MSLPGTPILALDPRDPRALQALTAYTEEVRVAAGLTALDVASALAGVDDFAAPHGFFLVVLHADQPVGCAGVRRIDDRDAEVKRMWIHPAHRGTGLATALLEATEDRARGLGYRRLFLDTNGALTAALRFYPAHGYSPVARYNDNPDATHFFAKSLIAGDPA